MRAFLAVAAFAVVLGSSLLLSQGVVALAPTASYGFAPNWGPDCYGPYSVNPYFGSSTGNCGRPGGSLIDPLHGKKFIRRSIIGWTNPIAPDRVIYR